MPALSKTGRPDVSILGLTHQWSTHFSNDTVVDFASEVFLEQKKIQKKNEKKINSKFPVFIYGGGCVVFTGSISQVGIGLAGSSTILHLLIFFSWNSYSIFPWQIYIWKWCFHDSNRSHSLKTNVFLGSLLLIISTSLISITCIYQHYPSKPDKISLEPGFIVFYFYFHWRNFST